MMLSESAGHPAVAALAQVAYDQIVRDGAVHYRLLDDLIGEASAKGVLRAIRAKYSPVAFDAMISPILQEIGRQKPIRSGRAPWAPADPRDDPLRAGVWPPR